MDKQPKIIGELKKDIKRFEVILRKASQSVQDQSVSLYPIFAVHKHELLLGIPIIDRDKNGSNWSFNISSMEEFITKGIIQEQKLEEFKKVYKNPNKYCCLFVCEEDGASFVFSPYTENLENKN